ncbi:11615_t:CDS:2, partial [Acaulospora colombiana]
AVYTILSLITREERTLNMTLRILSAKDVETLIATISLDELVGQTARLFHSASNLLGSQLIQCPPRTTVEMPGWTMLTMPAYVAGQGMSVKLVGVPQANNGPYRDLFGQFTLLTKLKNPALVDDGDDSKSQKAGLPATTIVVEERSGNVKSIINARHLTALRTAAGSLLATELLLLGASSSSHTAAPHEADGGERTRPKTLVLAISDHSVLSHHQPKKEREREAALGAIDGPIWTDEEDHTQRTSFPIFHR